MEATLKDIRYIASELLDSSLTKDEAIGSAKSLARMAEHLEFIYTGLPESSSCFYQKDSTCKH